MKFTEEEIDDALFTLRAQGLIKETIVDGEPIYEITELGKDVYASKTQTKH